MDVAQACAQWGAVYTVTCGVYSGVAGAQWGAVYLGARHHVEGCGLRGG